MALQPSAASPMSSPPLQGTMLRFGFESRHCFTGHCFRRVGRSQHGRLSRPKPVTFSSRRHRRLICWDAPQSQALDKFQLEITEINLEINNLRGRPRQAFWPKPRFKVNGSGGTGLDRVWPAEVGRACASHPSWRKWRICRMADGPSAQRRRRMNHPPYNRLPVGATVPAISGSFSHFTRSCCHISKKRKNLP
jgi:hypothetical protein